MHTLRTPSRLSPTRCILAALSLAALAAHAQTTYEWRGTTSTTFGTAGNWLSSVVLPVNGAPTPVFGRLNVFSNPNDLTYAAAQGSTIVSNGAGRGLVIAGGAAGTMHITGGTFSTFGSTNLDVIGNSLTGPLLATLNVSGGTFIGAAPGTAMGAGLGPSGGPGGVGTVNVSGTGLLRATSLILANLTNCTVNLNGGTLEANNVTNISYNTSGASFYTATFRFNGGTLKARTNDTRFLQLLSYASAPTVVANAFITNGGAIIDSAGFNVTIPTALLREGASTGGLTKNGAGSLTLGGTNTYTGATIVNQGGLAMALPTASSSLVLGAGTTNNLTLNGTNWALASAALTNSSIAFNYGVFNGNTAAALRVTNLTISGSVTCNISGLAIPATNITLLTYASGAHPGGNFVLGSLPSGMVAALNDDGANVVLAVTTGSSQNLTWSASVNNTWQVGGAANWNSGTATYLEAGATGDLVTFNDTVGGTVNVSGTVKPASMTVSNVTASHTFGGSGKISGPTGISKLGSSLLTLSTSNDFTGNIAISGGSVAADNGGALGATNGNVTVSGPANTLIIGATNGVGVTVSGKSVTISGTGVGGSRGALRGANTNANVWAGPVVFTSELTRIGAEDNCKLEITGPISDGGGNFRLLLRPGAGATVKLSGTGSSYGITRTFTSTGTVILGANNALSTNGLELGPGTLDLNGFNQTVNFHNDDSGSGTIVNNGAAPVTFTVNNLFGESETFATLQNGTATLNFTKLGGNRHTLKGTNTYTGATTVGGGTLQVNGILASGSAVSVTNGALAGTGTVGGPVTVGADGAIAPGVSGIGTLTLGGATTLGGSFVAEINRNAGSPLADKLNATGGVTLGGTLVVNNLGAAAQNGDTFDLFDGAVSGAFTAFTLPPGGLAHWKTNNLVVNGTITFSNTAPVAPAQTAGVVLGGTLTLPVIGGKITATDADGDALIVTATGTPSSGTAGFAGSNVTYNATGSLGTNTFTYTVSDGLGGTATNTVTVLVSDPLGFNLVSATASLGTAYLTYLGLPGTNYALDITHTLPATNWAALFTNTADGTGFLYFSNQISLSPTNDFYRTRYVP